MSEYIYLNSWKYCPNCDSDILGVSGKHDYCCWCGTKLEDIQQRRKLKDESQGDRKIGECII